MTNYNHLLDDVSAIAEQAAQIILRIYQETNTAVRRKADNSPVTEADNAANEYIVDALKRLTPQWPVLSEENEMPDAAERSQWQTFWLVDPLDGTREFLAGNGQFTVNIALIEHGEPVLGVVHVPVSGISYRASHQRAEKILPDGSVQPLRCRDLRAPVIMLASGRNGLAGSQQIRQAIRQQLGPVATRMLGSSLKLCLIADGEADIYPRLAPTYEWDTAAGHAIVNAAGGAVVDRHFKPLRYNKPQLLNPHFLVLGQALSQWSFLQQHDDEDTNDGKG